MPFFTKAAGGQEALSDCLKLLARLMPKSRKELAKVSDILYKTGSPELEEELAQLKVSFTIPHVCPRLPFHLYSTSQAKETATIISICVGAIQALDPQPRYRFLVGDTLSM